MILSLKNKVEMHTLTSGLHMCIHTYKNIHKPHTSYTPYIPHTHKPHTHTHKPHTSHVPYIPPYKPHTHIYT